MTVVVLYILVFISDPGIIPKKTENQEIGTDDYKC